MMMNAVKNRWIVSITNSCKSLLCSLDKAFNLFSIGTV